MKRLSIIIFTLILVKGMCFSGIQTNNAWKTLKKMKTIGVLKTYRATIQKVKKRYERGFIVELGPVREVLEKAGINEKVTIEVRHRSKLVERLGTYEPVTNVKDGESVVSFDSIPVGIRIFKNLSRTQSDFRDDIERKRAGGIYRPQFLQLVFKNAAGKIKVRLKVTFLYIKG